jgi:formate dehydrogenase subunit gamma
MNRGKRGHPTRSCTRSLVQKERGSKSEKILRFEKTERLMHWAIAVPFLVCYTSALVLLVLYNPNPLRPLRFLFSWIHRISGVCLFILPVLVFLNRQGNRKLHLSNMKRAWLWSFTDVKWLFRMAQSVFIKKTSLPEEGKFNAGEKMNFLMVITTYPLFIFTGLLIWIPGISFYSWIFHVLLALVATPFIFGHMFLAMVNPGTRKGFHGVISGFVDSDWAKHHYRRWYRENFEKGPKELKARIKSAKRIKQQNIPSKPNQNPAAPASTRKKVKIASKKSSQKKIERHQDPVKNNEMSHPRA